MFLGPSNTAGKIEIAFLIMVGASVLLLLAVTFLIILFLIKYNQKKHPQPVEVKESLFIEILWTVIPTIIVLLLFYFGWKDFDYLRNPPENALPVTVISRQWSWQFEYANGRLSDVLRAPINKPLRLTLTSLDVIHCLFIPAFRIKEDCVPGLKTRLWFSANEVGSYDIYCTEYCGVGHSHMRSKVVAMSQEDFEKWYKSPEREGSSAKAEQLLQKKGCNGCHSIDGSEKIGPTLKGIFKKKKIILTHGKEKEVIADEEYLRKMILKPGVDILKGYPPIMPAIPLTEDELKTLVDFLKGLQ
jgi:cytochrome c oxidase subunit II